MKYANFVFAAILTLIILAGYNKKVFSTGFFALFSGSRFSENGLSQVKGFDPEEDVLYLPGLENKELFESIEDLSLWPGSGRRLIAV